MKLLVAHTLALGGSPITAIDLVAGPRRHGHDDSRQSSDDLPVQVFDELGYNYKLSDILAAIALVQLDRGPALLTARRRIGERYRDSLDGVVGLTLPGTADDRDHAWQTYALTLAPECSRDAVAARASFELSASDHWDVRIASSTRLPDHSGVPDVGGVVTATARDPHVPGLSEKDIDFVADTVPKAVSRSLR